MTCLICLEKIDEECMKSDCNLCDIKYHKNCYLSFKKNSNFDCPICRNIVRKQYYHDSLLEYVFRFPGPIAILLWFVISWLFVIFIFPQVFAYHIYSEYKIMSISIIFTHIGILFMIFNGFILS